MNLGEFLGQRLGGRYMIESELGRGAMGAVFEARDHAGTQVAVKVILPGADADHHRRLLPRFLREARLAARLHHPNVVRVLDAGRWNSERASAFLVMELVDGVGLDRLLGSAALATEAACDLIAQVARGLAHVHAHGVLHRDVKPENVLVSRDPSSGRLRARLTDFGLAAAVAEARAAEADGATRLTQAGTVLGTPVYMAPEQAEGRVDVGPPADLYPLGVMLYHALAGAMPFDGPLTSLLVAKLTRDPPPLTPRPGVSCPDALRDVIMRCLAREPRERFGFAADLVHALEPFAAAAVLDVEAWSRVCRGDSPSGEMAIATLDGRTRVDAVRATRFEPSDHGHGWVGRDRELAHLDVLATRAEGGDGQVVMVVGDAGIGKSALAERATVALNEAGRFQVLRGLGAAHSDALAALRNAVDRWLGTLGRPRDVVAAAVRRVLAAEDESSDAEHAALVDLLRPADHGGNLREAIATLFRHLRRLARRRPVCLFLDNLEDSEDTATILELARFELSLESFPMLLLATMPTPENDAVRRALSAVQPKAGSGSVERITVGPLPLDALALHLEREHGLSPHQAERVAKRCGGNPLFAEHFAAAGGSHDTRIELGRDSLGSGSHGALPTSLRILLEASLDDRLQHAGAPSRARRLLELLAILGVRAEVSLLEAMLRGERDVGDTLVRDLDDDLDDLIGAGLLVDDGDAVSFTHPLMCDVVAANIGPRRARRLHRRAAEARVASDGPVDRGQVGHHWAAAGANDRAIEAFVDATIAASAAGETRAIAHWGTHALQLMDETHPLRLVGIVAVARALRADADLDAAVALLEPVFERSIDRDEADDALAAGEVLAEIRQERADSRGWNEVIARMDALVEDATDAGRGAWLRARAFLANSEGDFAAALVWAREALPLSKRAQQHIAASSRLVWALLGTGDEAGARDAADACIERAGQRPDLRAEALRLRVLVYSHSGDLERLREAGAEMRELQRRSGRVARRVSATCDLARALGLNGDFEAAETLLLEAHQLATRFGLTLERIRAELLLSLVEVRTGRREAALARIERPEMRQIFEVNPVVRLGYAIVYVANERTAETLELVAAVGLDTLPPSQLFAWLIDQIGRGFWAIRDRLDATDRRHAVRLVRTAGERWRRVHRPERAEACDRRAAELESSY